MKGLKRAVSVIWSGANRLARRRAEGRRVRLPVRVISVGNIQAGGAGKTPLVARIAREAGARGLMVCILSRGYGSHWEGSAEGGILSPGEALPATEFCGDEPALLHELAPAAWIGVGADRVAQFARVAARAKIDCVILDDGFQNFRIVKDLEIVAVTSARPGEKVFRDFPSALSRADLVVWTKGEHPPAYGNTVPCVRAQFRIPPADSMDPRSAEVFLVTGLADGAAAYHSVEAAGFRIAEHLEYADHARYTAEQVRDILSRAQARGLGVALTGKDWVKWRELGVPADQVRVLEPVLELSATDQVIWERVLWAT